MSPLDNKITDKIKATVMSLDPEAEVYIYGSRARGDALTESDWDVMVITPRHVTPQLKRSIRHALYEIEWDNECVISSIIHSREEWDNRLMRTTPFYRNVTRDAVRI
jgi:uncharacterized protein